MTSRFNKLIEIAAGGFCAFAGLLFATWMARREGEARIIAAQADAQVLKIRAAAHVEAREIAAPGGSVAGSELELTDRVLERIQYRGPNRVHGAQALVRRAEVGNPPGEMLNIAPHHDRDERGECAPDRVTGSRS